MRNIKTSKILYVEDDAEAAELCRVILNDQGYEVAIADTGKLGLEMYRDGDFDAVLLDYRLPDIDGLEVAEEILSKNPNAAIVFLSARGSEAVAAEAMALGVTFYVIKDNMEVYSTIVPELLAKAAARTKERRAAAEMAENYRVSEEKYRSIVENTAEGIITIDDKGIIESFNPQAEILFGYQDSEVIGENIAILVPDADREQHDKYFEKSDLHGWRIVNRARDFEGLRKDGSLFAMELNVSPMFVAGSKKFIGILRDITQRKKSEEALKHSEDRFRSFAESAADRFWETDEDFRFTYVSGLPEDSSRLKTEEMIGKIRWDVEGLDLEDEIWQHLKKNVTEQKPIRDFQYRRVLSDGSETWLKLNANPFYDEDGVFLGYRGTNSEITDNVQAQITQDRFFAAMEKLDAGFVLWGADKKLLASNQTFRQQQGEPAVYIKPGEDYSEYMRNIAEDQIANGIEIGDIEKWIDKRVADFDSDMVDREAKNANGDFIRIRKRRLPDGAILAFHQDINDVKKNEQELKTAVDFADTANKAKSDFLSSMSHELRTPLNAILGFGQLLEHNPKEPLSEKQNDHVRQILKGGAHLLDLIDQVLELSKIESGNFSVSIENVEPKVVIEESLVMVQTQAAEKHVGLEFVYSDDDMSTLWTDSNRLCQILLNLLSNAIKYNRGGGNVVVSLGKPEGNFSRISVSDTGLGVPKIKQAGLFEPFNRLGRESGEIEGTGIGLTITKQLVELMGAK